MKNEIIVNDITEREYRKRILESYVPPWLTIDQIKNFSNECHIPMCFEEFPEEIRFDIYCFRKDYDEIYQFIEERRSCGMCWNLIIVDSEIEYTQQALIEYRGNL